MSEMTEEQFAKMAESWKADAEAHLVDLCREWTKQIVGTNCMYVDDDLRILAHLANRALEAGLTDNLPDSIVARLPLQTQDQSDKGGMSTPALNE